MNPEETSKNPKGDLSQIRTYQGDVAHAIKNQKESLASIQQTEATRKRSNSSSGNAHQTISKRKEAILLALGAVILVVLASFGGWYTYREYARRSAPPTPEIPESRLIATALEESLIIATSTPRADFIKLLRDTSENIPNEQIKHVVLKTGDETRSTPMSTESFFRILETNAPSSLIRSLSPIFMFGILGGEKPSSFIIIRLESFENTYSRMLYWENDMVNDIGPIFPSATRLTNITSTEFKDVINKNKDVRILYDEENKEVLLYSFLNNDTLIITDNLTTLHTIISRITAESLVR